MDKRMPTLCVEKDVMFFSDRPLIQALGARLVTSSLTTRGLREEDMHCVADYIDEALQQGANEVSLRRLRVKVNEWISEFPLYV